MEAHPAAMVSFSSRENIQALAKRLRRIHPSFEDVEIKELVLYGDVEERLRRAKIGYGRAYDPRGIPPGQV